MHLKVTVRSKDTYLPSRPSDEGCEEKKQALLMKAAGAGVNSGNSQVSPIGKKVKRMLRE